MDIEFKIHDVVKLKDGRVGRITGYKQTRVRFTRFDRSRGVNVTTWMKWGTFLDKEPVVVLEQFELF